MATHPRTASLVRLRSAGDRLRRHTPACHDASVARRRHAHRQQAALRVRPGDHHRHARRQPKLLRDGARQATQPDAGRGDRREAIGPQAEGLKKRRRQCAGRDVEQTGLGRQRLLHGEFAREPVANPIAHGHHGGNTLVRLRLVQLPPAQLRGRQHERRQVARKAVHHVSYGPRRCPGPRTGRAGPCLGPRKSSLPSASSAPMPCRWLVTPTAATLPFRTPASRNARRATSAMAGQSASTSKARLKGASSSTGRYGTGALAVESSFPPDSVTAALSEPVPTSMARNVAPGVLLMMRSLAPRRGGRGSPPAQTATATA